MFVTAHPAQTTLRGDQGYNPRDISVTPLAGGSELLTGVFRDDGAGSTGRPNRLFHIVIPADFVSWHELNTRIFYALRNGTSQIVMTMG